VAETQRWIPAYIGVGSNLDDPEAQVKRALHDLKGLPCTQLVAVSGLYRTPPMGPQDQPDYVNAVAGLLTRQLPEKLLLSLQNLESSLGRVRTKGDRWGPRVIDLDILVYGTVQQTLPGLSLPHPGILERNFVLLPLREIAPSLIVPGQGVVRTLANRLGNEEIRRIEA
jgi:2-amino-4-hydroxy-6-hydroxymethyldihydropteridine diphosphokinase